MVLTFFPQKEVGCLLYANCASAFPLGKTTVQSFSHPFSYWLSFVIDLFLIYLFYKIILFLAVLGLCCFKGFSLAVWRFFFAVASVEEHGLYGMRSSGVAAQGLNSCASLFLQHRLKSCGARSWSTPWHMGSSRIRDWTCVSHTGRQILHHWDTREALLLIYNSLCMLYSSVPQFLLPFLAWPVILFMVTFEVMGSNLLFPLFS